MDTKEKHKRSVNITGGLYDAYKFYKGKNCKPTVTKEEYSKICQLFNKKISDKIISESYEFKIPFGLGYLRIKGNKSKIRIKDGRIDPNRMPINWPETKKIWAELYNWPNISSEEFTAIKHKKYVFFTNEETDGYIYRWYWDKRTSNFKNQSVYNFRPVKGGVTSDNYHTGRLGIASWIKSGKKNNEYYG